MHGLVRQSVTLLLMLITICSMSLADDNAKFIRFSDPSLIQGRVVWMENCMGCHAYGTAGAPVPLYPDEWRHRLTKTRTVLYQHAIEGFYGPEDTIMPARGGNPALSDGQVKRAVDYMVALASYYIKKMNTGLTK